MKDFSIMGWSELEIKRLLSFVLNRGDKSLLSVFDDFASKTGRRPYSVRNFYYKLINLAEKNSEVAKAVNFNKISNNMKNNHFSQNDTKSLLRTLLNNDKNISVRRACLNLANGDAKLMIRYQNKYRNILKTNIKLVNEVANELRQNGVRVRKYDKFGNNLVKFDKNYGNFNDFAQNSTKFSENYQKNNKIAKNTAKINENYLKNEIFNQKSAKFNEKTLNFDKFNQNIAVMPTQNDKLTENDMQALFLGLVRLVKRSAEHEVAQNLKREAEFANSALQNSLIDLRRKEVLIAELKEQNEKLKIKLDKLEKNFQKNQEKMVGNISTISVLLGNSKIDELKNFVEKLSLKERGEFD